MHVHDCGESGTSLQIIHLVETLGSVSLVKLVYLHVGHGCSPSESPKMKLMAVLGDECWARVQALAVRLGIRFGRQDDCISDEPRKDRLAQIRRAQDLGVARLVSVTPIVRVKCRNLLFSTIDLLGVAASMAFQLLQLLLLHRQQCTSHVQRGLDGDVVKRPRCCESTLERSIGVKLVCGLPVGPLQVRQHRPCCWGSEHSGRQLIQLSDD
mmetsp:Transcript_10144/g.24830  ORF Transcript_10144/g.24830 Transcript_10144/m.24830 type:complete len:211 (-) Transcript_10144:4741-5373(-)